MRMKAIGSLLLALGSVPVQAATSPRAVVEASLAAVNRHDSAALAALYADDAVVIASDNCQPSIGPAAVKAGHEALVKAMPDLSVEATDWVVEGDRVAILFTARSTAIPGGAMTLADFLTVKRGRIVRDVTIFNSGGPAADGRSGRLTLRLGRTALRHLGELPGDAAP